MTTIIGSLVYGTAANDAAGTATGAVIGNNADNVVYGFDGNDQIYGAGGNDLMYGGAGNDTVFGEAGNDTLTGDNGTNWIYGGDGNDVMIGVGGLDHYYGGAGFDTVDYSMTSIGAYIDVAAHQGQAGDTVYSVEKFIGSTSIDTMQGDASANQFFGNDGADLLHGGDGNDVLSGGNGNDLLDGGNGADQLFGNAGNDTLQADGSDVEVNGGAGYDTATYAASAGGVIVQMINAIQIDGPLVLDGPGVVNQIEHLIGSGFGDYLTGSSHVETIDGGAGNDWIIGGYGADSLIGGTGTDIVDYGQSAAAVQVDLKSGYGGGGDAEGDHLSGFENMFGSSGADDLHGTDSANILWGGGGGDSLDGRAGNDTLFGMAGKDHLNGGDGADHFTWLAVSESAPGTLNRDVVIDFSHTQSDKLDFHLLDAKGGTSGDQAFTFINHASFSGEGQIRSYFQGNDTFLEVNTQGAGGAEMEIVVLGHQNLGSGDFVL